MSTRFSWPVRSSSTEAYCPVSPTFRRTIAGSFTTSWPSTEAEPPSGRSRVARILIVVVLPAPFGPSRPKTEPFRICRSTPLSARVSPKFLTRAFVWIAISIEAPNIMDEGRETRDEACNLVPRLSSSRLKLPCSRIERPHEGNRPGPRGLHFTCVVRIRILGHVKGDDLPGSDPAPDHLTGFAVRNQPGGKERHVDARRVEPEWSERGLGQLCVAHMKNAPRAELDDVTEVLHVTMATAAVRETEELEADSVDQHPAPGAGRHGAGCDPRRHRGAGPEHAPETVDYLLRRDEHRSRIRAQVLGHWRGVEMVAMAVRGENEVRVEGRPCARQPGLRRLGRHRVAGLVLQEQRIDQNLIGAGREQNAFVGEKGDGQGGLDGRHRRDGQGRQQGGEAQGEKLHHQDRRGRSSSVVASRSGSAKPRTHFCDAFVLYLAA